MATTGNTTSVLTLTYPGIINLILKSISNFPDIVSLDSFPLENIDKIREDILYKKDDT